MIKEILLDVDGVVIRPKHKYFSTKYSEDYGVPIEGILPFFKNEYQDAAVGKVQISDVLPPYLKRWGWEGTLEDFMRYWYESERDLDERVMKTVRELRKSGLRVSLASVNEAGRVDYLMNKLGLENEFDSGFFSAYLGKTKTDPAFFELVAEKLEIETKNIEYWDDDPQNVETAKSVGVNANLYSDYKKFNKKILQNLNK